ncbi:MAG TPA: hypothetical protein VLT86_05345 [Vicinamibacterales bacterium]|nr:hypothetical protein [Vicinamibacterales bacterium]
MQGDLSSFLALLLAVQAGTGLASPARMGTTAYGGIKIGAARYRQPPTVTLDLGYDHVASHSGLGTELSAMVPVFRSPGPQTDPRRNYLRVYVEPGVGYHAGTGLGGYASAKMMFAVFSDRRLRTEGGNVWSPYVELQRRLPFGHWRDGDTRFTFGIIAAVCNRCTPHTDLGVRALRSP